MKYLYLFSLVLCSLCLLVQPAIAINMCTAANTVTTNRYICGNGICETGEVCDDGEYNNDYAPDKCRPDCRLYGCGDGVTDTGEECDTYSTRNEPNKCRSNCTLPYCGDGIVDDAAPYNEECDDGNSNNSDGCSTSCKVSVKTEINSNPSGVKPLKRDIHLQGVPQTEEKKTAPETKRYKGRVLSPLSKDEKKADK